MVERVTKRSLSDEWDSPGDPIADIKQAIEELKRPRPCYPPWCIFCGKGEADHQDDPGQLYRLVCPVSSRRPDTTVEKWSGGKLKEWP